MWLVLQQDEPDDYVIATGKEYSVKQFVEECDKYFKFGIEWHKSGMDEVGYSRRLARNIITVNERYFRPAEVERLLGDATKAKKVLGWEPKTSFDQLVKEMCENES